MKRRQREALVVALDKRLDEQGSWCGETHLQKAVYFLQALLEVPLGFAYILYKYGPFSRELRGELAAMRADGFLELVPQPAPYGPTLQSTPVADEQLLSKWPKTLTTYGPAINFVAERLGGLGVGELERLATALWVIRDMPEADDPDRARRVNELKSHVSEESALDALRRVHDMERDAAGLAA